MVCKAKKGVNEETGKASKGIFVFVFLRKISKTNSLQIQKQHKKICVWKVISVHRFQALSCPSDSLCSTDGGFCGCRNNLTKRWTEHKCFTSAHFDAMQLQISHTHVWFHIVITWWLGWVVNVKSWPIISAIAKFTAFGPTFAIEIVSEPQKKFSSSWVCVWKNGFSHCRVKNQVWPIKTYQ